MTLSRRGPANGSPRATLVLTTIFDPVILEDYFENFKRFRHLDHVEVIVIPDRKTPAEAYQRCHGLKQRGLDVLYPTLEEQQAFLKRLDLPPNFIPENSDNRRNVGYLMALESHSDFVISLDDDNFCFPDTDVIAEHAVVCHGQQETQVVSTETGWFNLCHLLELDRVEAVYPRGYPYYARHRAEHPARSSQMVDVHLNAGLWLESPDLDGMTWLVAPTMAKAFKGSSVVLGPKTWTPINTQNTALHRDAIAAYYFVRMGPELAGLPIDRYGDIFSGYFVQACTRHLGGAIRAGTPVAAHRRNRHDYFRDAASELGCILVLEDLLPWLTEVRLEGATYVEAYTSLSDALDEAVEAFQGKVWTEMTRGYFHEMADCMRQWIRAYQLLTSAINV